MSVSLPRAWLGEGQRGAMYGAGSLRMAVATSRGERFFLGKRNWFVKFSFSWHEMKVFDAVGVIGSSPLSSPRRRDVPFGARISCFFSSQQQTIEPVRLKRTPSTPGRPFPLFPHFYRSQADLEQSKVKSDTYLLFLFFVSEKRQKKVKRKKKGK